MNNMNTNADETDSDNSNLTSGTDLLELINELSNESPDNIYKCCCFNEDIWNEICNIVPDIAAVND